MKLCLVANPNSAHTRRLVKYFYQAGLEISLIGEHALLGTPPEGCAFYDLTRTTNIRKARYAIWSWTIRKLLRQIKPDILHAVSITSAGWLAAASSFHPWIATAIGSDLMLLQERNLLNRTLTRWALGQADYVTCVSKGLATKAQQSGARREKLQVTYFGVDLDVFKQESEKKYIRQILDIGDSPLVLSIRAISPLYNQSDIARAIPLVLKKVPDAKFAFFTYHNDPATLYDLNTIIESQQTSHAVILIDPISDDALIADYFRSADLAISIPSSDGTPTSVLEAMACGIPVIASDLPSLQDWITPGENGSLVPVGDIDTLSSEIIRLLSDSNLRQRFGVNAALKIQQQGDKSRFVQQMVRIYHELAG